jgi:protein TonB
MEAGNRLSRCLLDQKDDESRRARRLRRRTLLLSILIQALLLTLLLLRPLFGAQELRMTARLVPLPPWKGQPGVHAPTPHPAVPRYQPHHIVLPPPRICYTGARPAAHVQSDEPPDVGPNPNATPGEGPGDPNGLIPFPGPPGPVRPAPPPPPREVEAPSRRPRVVPPEIQQALLVVRVEPQYPALAKQIHLEGTVHIRAIIARDGTVQSAEVLSGHPWLASAARDAILRWRYLPTLLRGEPVEVETLITVIFRMQ